MIRYRTQKQILETLNRELIYTFTGYTLLKSTTEVQSAKPIELSHKVTFKGLELADRAYIAAKLKSKKAEHRRHCKLVFSLAQANQIELVAQEGRSEAAVAVDITMHLKKIKNTDKGGS